MPPGRSRCSISTRYRAPLTSPSALPLHREERPIVFHKYRLSIVLVASVLFGMGAVLAPAVEAAVMSVLNNDNPGEGFNDPTPVAPVGGNTGTTLGQQRLIAFQAAANKWGATLNSSVTIRIRSQWT